MKQNKLAYAHDKIVNLYIVYELKNRRVDNPDFTVQNGLFGAVKVTKNSSHSTNKTQNICVLGKDFVQGRNNTTIYAEKIY